MEKGSLACGLGITDAMYSKPIQQLISAFSKLPSVGERTAERYVFYLLKSGKKNVAELTLALKNLIESIKTCPICFDFTDSEPCLICADKRRDHSTICVVEESQNVQTIEKTGEYHGVYHVLRGVIKADEDNLGELKINELIKRLSAIEVPTSDGKDYKSKEVILALNPDLNGETTMMYLAKKIKANNLNIKISRLARGLPMGSDLQYADEITLANAIKNRNIQ